MPYWLRMESKADLELIKNSIEKGDEKKVLDALRDRDLYTLVWPHGECVLHWAAASNNVAVAKYAVENGLHVNIENYRGTTPLYYGAMQNSTEVCKFLLENGASPRIRSGFSGQFPHEAAGDSKLKELLAAGAEPERDQFVNYHHRVYAHWRANLNWFFRPAEMRRGISGMTVEPLAQKLVEEKGIAALADKCQQLLDEFRRAPLKVGAKVCLACGKDSNKRCGKCKKVYFCDQSCQKAAHKFHRFDC